MALVTGIDDPLLILREHHVAEARKHVVLGRARQQPVQLQPDLRLRVGRVYRWRIAQGRLIGRAVLTHAGSHGLVQLFRRNRRAQGSHRDRHSIWSALRLVSPLARQPSFRL